jgi:hypothetical protein
VIVTIPSTPIAVPINHVPSTYYPPTPTSWLPTPTPTTFVITTTIEIPTTITIHWTTYVPPTWTSPFVVPTTCAHDLPSSQALPVFTKKGSAGAIVNWSKIPKACPNSVIQSPPRTITVPVPTLPKWIPSTIPTVVPSTVISHCV